MNMDSPLTATMLPGQISSNKLKQIASNDSIMSVRGLYGRPFTCSAAATPVLISNSYLLKFFVDNAMYKRMLIFPCETNFSARNVDPNVVLGERIVNTGLRVVHARLVAERTAAWQGSGGGKGSGDANAAAASNYARVVREWMATVRSSAGTDSAPRAMSHYRDLVSEIPSVFLRHVASHRVLELSDNSDLIKLQESANTFFQAHASAIMLAARPNTLLVSSAAAAPAAAASAASSAAAATDIGADTPAAASHRQFCTLNPINMDTMRIIIDRAKIGGVWGLVNAALRPVLFVELPYLDTSMVHGEGDTLKLRTDAVTFNVSFGVRVPDVDADARVSTGTTGVGQALMRQLVWSWGSNNSKDVMYPCHHLHMLFELVLQETNRTREMSTVGNVTSDTTTLVAFMLVYSVYIDMFERRGVFVASAARSSPSKRARLCGAADGGGGGGSGSNSSGENVPAAAAAAAASTRYNYPRFAAMVINKRIEHLNNMTNLTKLSGRGKRDHHSAKLLRVMNMFPKMLKREYLCDSCAQLAYGAHGGQ